MDDATFPYLYDVSTDSSHPLSDRDVVVFGAAETCDVGIKGVAANERLFQIEAPTDGCFLQPLSKTQPISVNQAPVTKRTTLKHLAIIQAGPRLFVFVEHDDPSISTSYTANQWLIDQLLQASQEAPPAEIGRTLLDVPSMDDSQLFLPPEFPGAIELPARQMLIGRDSTRADICLPDVRVSRVHGWISRTGNTATITDLKSANGTFVNGQPVQQPREIQEGDRIQIGPYNLVFTGDALFPLSHDKNVQLVANDLVRRVPDRKHWGKKKVILDDVSLVIRPKEFVCILGPSGSGKTTLLSALSARVRADEGQVMLNGQDLYAHFDALKQNLTVVPQKDVLHDVLPLNLALRYTAKLRLPGDMSRHDIEWRIDEMLDSVNLTQHQYTQIRRLSGGQIKRASWVNEVICNPSLIFLDEVTSGLDDQTDCEMMQLFRRIADEGKTIICVTHSVTYVEQQCDLVVILATGGSLAFVGPPADALKYFNISRLGEVYQRLKEKPANQWKDGFRQTGFYEQYVERRLPNKVERRASDCVKSRQQPRELLAIIRQFLLLTRRYFSIKCADRRAMVMMFGQSLFIALLLAWLFGDISNMNVEDEANQIAQLVAPGLSLKDLFEEDQEKILKEAEEIKRADLSSKLLFLLAISSLWLGCNSSAKEIVKERSIYTKERDVGLNVISYYGSKLALLSILCVLQTSLLFWIVRTFTHLGGEVGEQWLLLSLSSVTGVSIGLAISAMSTTEDLAVTIVPITLIPQIILAGLIAPLADLTRVFSQTFISSYWSYQGLLYSLSKPLQDRLRDASALDLEELYTQSAVCSLLGSHIAFFALLAIVALYARDIRHGSSRRWLGIG